MIKKFVIFCASLCLFPSTLNAACQNSIPETTPSSDFAVHGDGTVTHKKTGLMWKVCTEGQIWSADSCTGIASQNNWRDALQLAATLNISGGYAGYTDWRIPNVKELASIMELSCENPAINSSVFPGTTIEYWTATPYEMDDFFVVNAYFSNGHIYINGRIAPLQVRLVRDLQ